LTRIDIISHSVLVAINLLLKQLEQITKGVNIADMYVGLMARADDIRSITNRLTALEAQSNTVSLYTGQNCLKINVAKFIFRLNAARIQHCKNKIVIFAKYLVTTVA